MRARSIGSLALGLLVLAMLGSIAHAKPKIAILGLEVIGSLDPEQVKLAKQLTSGLRERASAGTGPYELAPNSDKELVDEKLMNNCGTEALICMAPIGLAMKADYLMWGKIEKVDKGFHITIKLIRVATKLPLPTFTEVVPIGDIKNDPKGVAKRAYALMTATDEGTVTIRVANVDRAVVYLNDQPKGTTSSGVLTFTVPEGKHRIAVVANEKGWRRYEDELSMNAGDQRNIPVELTREKDPPKDPKGNGNGGGNGNTGGSGGSGQLSHGTTGVVSGGSGGSGWRSIAVTTTVLAVVGAVVYGGSWFMLSRAGDAEGLDYSCTTADKNFGCDHGDALLTASYVGGIGAAVLASVSVFAFYKSSSAKERPVTGGRSTKARRELTVTPVVSAQGGGATLRFDW